MKETYSYVLAEVGRVLGIFFLKQCIVLDIFNLKSLGPIDRTMIHGHGKNVGFVLFEYIIKPCSRFYKYTNIRVMKKNQRKKHVNSKQKVRGIYGYHLVSYLIFF